MYRKVNRFTFDAHSVVLFSALVLSSAVSAGTPSSALSRTQLTPVTASSVNVRINQSAVAQKTLTHTAATAHKRRDTDRQRD